MLGSTRIILIIAGIILASLATSCAPGPTTTNVDAETTGHFSVEFFVHVDEDWSYPVFGSVMSVSPSIGDTLRFSPPSKSSPIAEPRPTTALLTVEQAGLTTLSVEQWEEETGSGFTTDGWLRQQVFFAIPAPAGAEIEVPLSYDVDPLDMQLKVDYEADGTVDAVVSPTVSAEGEDLETKRPTVEPTVEKRGTGQAIVSFIPTANSPTPVAIYYAIFPSHPQLQRYTDPIVVDEGSYLLYSAVSETGNRQLTGELSVLGGIADDVRRKAHVDGRSIQVETTVPGQRALITFDGEQGQQVAVAVGPTTGGVQPDNQATMTITGPDGTGLREVGTLGSHGLGEDPWSEVLDLPADGIYTITIDPRLANVINTTLALTSVQ